MNITQLLNLKVTDLILMPVRTHRPPRTDSRRRKMPATERDKAYARRRATMRSNRNARWAKAFEELNNRATSHELAEALGYTVPSVNSQLRLMLRETPPTVVKVGEEEKTGGGAGNNKYIYSWIGL